MSQTHVPLASVPIVRPRVGGPLYDPATISGAAVAPTGVTTGGPAPANPAHTRSWTPEEWANRQAAAIREIERAAAGNDAEQARRATLGLLTETSTTIADMQRDLVSSAADRQRLQSLLDQQTQVSRLLAEQTEQLAASRAARGGPSHFRVLPDDHAAYDIMADILDRAPDIRSNVADCGPSHARTIERIMRHAEQRRSALAGRDPSAERRDLLGTPGQAGSGAAFSLNDRLMQIIGTVTKYTTAFQEIGSFPQATADFEVRQRGTRARAFRVARNATPTVSEQGEPTLITQRLQEYIGLGWLHYALLADANLMPGIVDIWLEDMTDSIAQLLESDVTIGVAGQAQSGLGYNPGNYWFTGFLNSSTNPALRIGQGQRFDAVTFDDILRAANALPTKFGNASQRLHLHRSVLYNFLTLKDGAGRYLFFPGAGELPATIGGYPFALWEQLPRTSESAQANRPFMAYGDLRRALRIGIGQQPTLSRNEHARWTERLVGFMLVARYSVAAWEPDAHVAIWTNP